MRALLLAAALLLCAPAPTLAGAVTETAGSLDGVPIIDRLDVADVAGGSINRYWLRAGTSPVGQPWLVPVVVVKGAQAGPRLVLTAGIHGDELNGIAVLHRLAAGIDPAQLSGTLTLVPGLNPPGLLQSSRQWTPDWSRSAPNLNREMPGREGTSAIADFAGRLWSRLIRPNADAAVDLHTQSRGTAYMMYAFASSPRTRRMAELVGPDIIKMDKGDKGTLENTLTEDGVPAITLELGRPEMFDDMMIARAEAGLLNLMREMKMLPGRVAPPPARLFVANDIAAVRATRPGWARLLLPI
uniref:M14 family metallopeptidase n=1 Tax=Sandarakinorhabdus rubra TaxID=2672568 RepID=UPI0013DC403C